MSGHQQCLSVFEHPFCLSSLCLSTNSLRVGMLAGDHRCSEAAGRAGYCEAAQGQGRVLCGDVM